VISSASAYQPDGLQARPDVNLDLYAQQLNEVRQYGGLASTATTTSLRSAEQTEIALFWAYDRPDTFRPYGQLIDIAMDVAAKKGNSMEQNAKLLACLDTALADAVICAWKAKYEVVQPRPYDLITGAFSDQDGVASTVRDTAWHSLLSSINGVDSPPFPDYISGHSAMGGAFAGVMTGFFGNNVNFSAASQELPGVTRYVDGFNDSGIQRNSFYEAGLEDAISRVYGGVHIREACTDSFDVGLRVGIAVANTFLA
jgi:membrane-associated phospholipid phosphatase